MVSRRVQSTGRHGLVNEPQRRQEEQALMTGLDLRGQPQMIGARNCSAPTSFDNAVPGRFRSLHNPVVFEGHGGYCRRL